VWKGLVVLDGKFAVGCACETDWMGWTVTVLCGLGVERNGCVRRKICCGLCV
jgi:hypothetical protein